VYTTGSKAIVGTMFVHIDRVKAWHVGFTYVGVITFLGRELSIYT
jgi:hypothetical protein